MPKILCILGMVVAGLIVLMFGLDLAIGIPFSKHSLAMDIGIIIAAGILGYLGWSTYKEQV